MNEIDHQREQCQRARLVRERNGNLHMKDHGQNSKRNLKTDNSK